MADPEKKERSNIDLQEAAREKALRLLDFRPRTSKELVDKLRSKGFESSLVKPLVARLEELGLLDDRRFAIDRARAMLLRKGWGPRKLRSDLFRRGVDEEFIREAIELAYAENTQEELIAREATKRYGPGIMEQGSADRQKAFRFLMGRGFEAEKVKDVLGVY